MAAHLKFSSQPATCITRSSADSYGQRWCDRYWSRQNTDHSRLGRRSVVRWQLPTAGNGRFVWQLQNARGSYVRRCRNTDSRHGRTDTLTMNGNIAANNATGTAKINGSIDFGTSGRTISTTAGGTLVVTGGLTTNASSTTHIVVNGGGTLDVQGDNSAFINPMQIGTADARPGRRLSPTMQTAWVMLLSAPSRSFSTQEQLRISRDAPSLLARVCLVQSAAPGTSRPPMPALIWNSAERLTFSGRPALPPITSPSITTRLLVAAGSRPATREPLPITRALFLTALGSLRCRLPAAEISIHCWCQSSPMAE